LVGARLLCPEPPRIARGQICRVPSHLPHLDAHQSQVHFTNQHPALATQTLDLALSTPCIETAVFALELLHVRRLDPSLTPAMAELKVWDTDPNIYLFTSLTAGSSHIITATSRMETILKANKIPFKGVDTATNELAKKLFQRRASGKKLPLIVKEGYVLGVWNVATETVMW
jgi:hypothetical protein